MTTTKTDDYQVHAERAAAIIAADKERTPAEQAALDAVNEARWVLWHTDAMTDLALAVIRLLSRADLLRDKKDEQRRAQADESWGAYSERQRTANIRALSALDELAVLAADRLEAGDDPAGVAEWLRETRRRITEAREERAA
jgi:hypothetical protein